MDRQYSRRDFLQVSAATLSALALTDCAGLERVFTPGQDKTPVYFTKDISANGLLNIYSRIHEGIAGKVGIKLHTGEPDGPNILPRDMVKVLQQIIPQSNLVETNTLYIGKRYTTADHRETLKTSRWDFCPVDIMDEDGAVLIPVKGGKHFTEMSVGKHMMRYDSLVVLTHFKGHAAGGFGGSLKNIPIGCADGRIGKEMIHGAPVKARNLGILASTDLFAIEQASIDMVYQLPEPELHDL